MANMTSQLLLLAVGLILVFCTTDVSAGETCPIYDRVYGNTYMYSHTEICGNGCCGRFPDYYCCALSTAAVAGIILGGLVIVCVSVFVCVQCLKKKSQKGRVIRPVPTTNTVIFTSTSGGYPMGQHLQPAHHHVPEPPPYKRVGSPPPGYSRTGQGAPPPYGAPMAPGYAAPYGSHGGFGQPAAPAPPAYAYGHRHGLSPAAPPAAAASASTAAPSAPDYACAPPHATPGTAPSFTRQFGYGQGQGRSTAAPASDPAPSTPALSTVPPTPAPAANERRRRLGGGEGDFTRPASVSVTSSSAAASATPGPARQGWSDEPLPSISNRNTLTTGNFASRLPPLPSD